jgi:hypothetical protein
MPVERELTIPTNYNNKLDCQIFIHIQKPMNDGVAPASIFTIRTADKSHDPVKARIIDSVHQPLKSLSTVFTYLSHGITAEQFRAEMKTKVPGVNDDTILAVYFYQKPAA